MNKKIKYIIIAVLVMLIGLPAIVMGSSITNSLIRGKSIPEAIEILAAQIDSLIGRVEILEAKQGEQERTTACNFASEVLQKAQMDGGIIDADLKNIDELITRITYQRDNSPKDQFQMWQSRLEKVQNLNKQYISAKDKCGDGD